MKKDRSLLLVLAILLIADASSAQVNSEVVVTPGATVTTTVASPGDQITTKVTTVAGRSVVTQFKDGTPVELDSDGSVHIVYPDGARVSAPDGMHILKDGTQITVKDGMRIP